MCMVIELVFAKLVWPKCAFKINNKVSVWNLNSGNPNFCEFRFQTPLCVWKLNFGFGFQSFHKSVWKPNFGFRNWTVIVTISDTHCSSLTNLGNKFVSFSLQESSVAKLGSVCRRVYRIFSHAYFHHRPIFDTFEARFVLKSIFLRFDKIFFEEHFFSIFTYSTKNGARFFGVGLTSDH